MQTYDYNNDIPQATDIISQSQGQLLTNTQSVYSIINVDHYTFNSSGSNDGWHKQVTFPAVGSSSLPSSPVGILDTQTSNSKSELFYLNSTANVQITNTSLASSSGEGMLPGGLQIRSGFTNSGTSITFGTAFPTGIISVQLTSYATGTQFDVTGTPSTTGFSFSPAIPGGAGVYWLAIGY